MHEKWDERASRSEDINQAVFRETLPSLQEDPEKACILDDETDLTEPSVLL